MVVSIVGIATVFGDLGLSMAAMQSQTLTQQQRSNLLWINVSLGILLSVLIVCTSPAIAGFYGKQELAPIGSALSVVFFLYSITPQLRAELASKLRYRWLATADVVAQVAGFVVAVVTAIAGFGYWSLVWNQIVVAAVTALLVSVGAHWRPNLPRRTPGMVPLLRYGVDTLGVQLLTYISGNVDNVLIGRFIGSGALGLYSRAAQLFRLPLQQIATPLTPVAVPVLSRLSETIDVFEAYARRAQLALGILIGRRTVRLRCRCGPDRQHRLGGPMEFSCSVAADSGGGRSVPGFRLRLLLDIPLFRLHGTTVEVEPDRQSHHGGVADRKRPVRHHWYRGCCFGWAGASLGHQFLRRAPQDRGPGSGHRDRGVTSCHDLRSVRPSRRTRHPSSPADAFDRVASACRWRDADRTRHSLVGVSSSQRRCSGSCSDSEIAAWLSPR